MEVDVVPYVRLEGLHDGVREGSVDGDARWSMAIVKPRRRSCRADAARRKKLPEKHRERVSAACDKPIEGGDHEFNHPRHAVGPFG